MGLLWVGSCRNHTRSSPAEGCDRRDASLGGRGRVGSVVGRTPQPFREGRRSVGAEGVGQLVESVLEG